MIGFQNEYFGPNVSKHSNLARKINGNLKFSCGVFATWDFFGRRETACAMKKIGWWQSDETCCPKKKPRNFIQQLRWGRNPSCFLLNNNSFHIFEEIECFTFRIQDCTERYFWAMLIVYWSFWTFHFSWQYMLLYSESIDALLCAGIQWK